MLTRYVLIVAIRERRPDDLVDPLSSDGEHHEPIEAERTSRCGRHLSQGGKKILVDRIAFAVDAAFLGHPCFKTAALLAGVGQFPEAVGEFDAARIEFEAFGHLGSRGSGRASAASFAG